MVCFPETGGCERWLTEPFVKELNFLLGAKYSHEVCLDIIIRDRAQPEVLYIDPNSGRELVIERKSVVWPPDYTERHSRDHGMRDLIVGQLPVSIKAGRYLLEFEHLFRGCRQQAEQYAREIVASIAQNLATVQAGRRIGSAEDGRKWCFRAQDPSEYGDWGEGDGLILLMSPRADRDFPSRLPKVLPAKLKATLTKTVASTARKFFEYKDALRVLLIQGYGDLEHAPAEWWTEALGKISVPTEIDEVWSAEYEYFDDGQEGWFFDRVWPTIRSALVDVQPELPTDH